jgi:phosphoribosylformylglycinamidine synthase
MKCISKIRPSPGDTLYIVGITGNEMGGSEYFQYLNGVIGGIVPKLDLQIDSINSEIILKIIREHLISCSHDCSKGGLSITLTEMAIDSNCGINIDLDKIPHSCERIDFLLFSETPSRFIIGTENEEKLEKAFSRYKNLKYSKIGKVMDDGDNITFASKNKKIINLEMEIAKKYYENLTSIMEN